MSINLNGRNDYSYLFSSLGTANGSSGLGNLGFLSDYASIKNGSYGKLMKAYYSGNSNASVNSIAKKTQVSQQNKESAKKLATVESKTDALKESADALLAMKKETDGDAFYKGVRQFVSDYNSVVSAVNDADDEKVTARAQQMVNHSVAYAKSLTQIGIGLNADGTLTLDEKTFRSADLGKVKSLFQGNGSYGYQTSAQASMIHYTAERQSSKAATYTGPGKYSSVMSSGNLYNNYF